MKELLQRIDRLNEIGIALSAEKDTPKLLELIMMGAKSLTHAEGGTLYSLRDDSLHFEIITNDALGIQMGGTSGNRIEFDPIPLHHADGTEKHNMVVTHCVLTGDTINIEDAYNEEGFDFTGTRNFDNNTGYRTQSILTFPLKDHEQEIIGVLQLINAKNLSSGEVIAFNHVDQQLAESLASQAAVALTQKRLIKELQVLFESFIKLIASAIDDKSPYTGGHCRRIPVLTMMLAEAVNATSTGPMTEFSIDDKDRYELETAAWLHDCGKVTTPEYVMDKATKLETIFDRIHLLEHRFEVLLRDLEINYLKACLKARDEGRDTDDLSEEYRRASTQLRDDLAFIRHVNIGGEFMDEAQIARVHKLAAGQWTDMDGTTQPALTEDEVRNLTIQRGTLTEEEREVIN